MLPGMIYFLAANAIWDLLLHSSSFNKWHHIIDGIIITIIPLEKIIYLMMLRNITKTISTNNLAMYRRYNLLGNRWLNYKASYINIMRNFVYFNDLFCKIILINKLWSKSYLKVNASQLYHDYLYYHDILKYLYFFRWNLKVYRMTM